MKNTILIYILLSILSKSSLVNATEQIKESVSIGDGSFLFYGFPLEQLITDAEFNQIYNVESGCSAAWRNYKGQWIILQDVLYLRYLVKDRCWFGSEDVEVFDLKKLFPDYDEFEDALKATWFSGEIVIPISESRPVEGKKTDTGHQYYEHQVIVYLVNSGDIESRKIEYRER